MRRFRQLLSICLCCLLPMVGAASMPERWVAAETMEWMADADNDYPTLERLRAAEPSIDWRSAGGEGVNAGFTAVPHWFRIEVDPVDSATEALRYLRIPEALMNRIELHVFHGEDEIAQHTMGTDYPFHQRPLAHSDFVIPVELSPHQTTRFYIRAQTNGSMQFEPVLWEPQAFAEQSRFEAIASGLFYGVMAVMVFYNLFVYLMLRDRSYLYYIAWVAAFTLFMGSLHGYTFQFLWPDAVAWNETSVTFFVALMGVAALLFTDSFLQLRHRWPLMHRVVWVLLGVSAVLVVLSLTLSYENSIRITSFHGLVIMAVILAIGAIMWVQGHRYARYFVMAWVALLLGTSALALSKFGVLPYNVVTANGAQIGAVIEVVLLSFALGDRINQERAARFQAQQEALSAAQEAQSAQQALLEAKEGANRELEHRVRERTRELEDALNRLETVNRFLEDVSNTDQLTGLNNRHCFVNSYHEEYRRANRQQYPVTVILMDIDHFKWFNDTYGHKAGDECLKAVASALGGCITRAGDILARYGGEEFIVMLTNTSIEGGAVVAERLRQAIADLELTFEGTTVPVTISLGVADQVPVDLHDPEQLIQQADEALYAAKGLGRNQVCRYWKNGEPNR